MSAAEKVHIYPDQIHPDVASVLQEYSVTPEEYHLLMDDVIFCTESPEDSYLSQPFLHLTDSFDSPKDRLEAYNEIRQEFIDDEIRPIAFAKQYAASELANLILSDYGLDSFESPKVLSDLQSLGIDTESLSIWHVVTALKSGERIFENIESPEEIALSLASGAYVTHSEEQFTQWYKIALYACGISLYEEFDDKNMSKYTAQGVSVVTNQMHELVSAVIARDSAIQRIVGSLWNRQSTPIQSVKQLIEMQNSKDDSAFQAYPEDVHPDLIAKLHDSRVTWEDLMYVCGGTALPSLPPEYFRFQWFASLLSEKIDIIGRAKSLWSRDNLSPIVEALGYSAADNIVFSRWEELLLQEIFDPKKFSLDSVSEPTMYWATIARLSSLPHLIPENAQVKTYVYYAYMLAEFQVINRMGHEQAKRQLQQGDDSFLAPDRLVDDVIAIADRAIRELFIPDVAAIFSNAESGVSLDATKTHIEFATEQLHRITMAQLDEVSARLKSSLRKR